MSGFVLVSTLALFLILGAAGILAALSAWRSLQRRIDRMSAVFENSAERLNELSSRQLNAEQTGNSPEIPSPAAKTENAPPANQSEL